MVGDDELWGTLQKCTGIGEQQARDYHDELGELVELIDSVQSDPRDNRRIIDAFRDWQNRCASLAKRLFRDILSGFSKGNPANKYLSYVPPEQRPGGEGLGEVCQGLRGLLGRLREAHQHAPPGAARDALVAASGNGEETIRALDGGEVLEGYPQASQARSQLTSAYGELVKQDASMELAAAIQDEVIAVGQVVQEVAQTPYDTQVLTPSRMEADDEATGLVVAMTPSGPEPLDGEVMVNGEPVLVKDGTFNLGDLAPALLAVPLLLKLNTPAAPEHALAPPILMEQPAEPTAPAQPALEQATPVLHPRDPIIVAKGQNLDNTTEARLVDEAGNAAPMRAEAGSSLERIYLAPPLPPGDYKLEAIGPDGQVVACPTTVTVPRLEIAAPPIKMVGEAGQIRVTSTAEAPLQVTVYGGEPQIEVPPEKWTVTVSKAIPGIVPFVAKQAGTYTVIARAESPARAEHQAVELPPTTVKNLAGDLLAAGLLDAPGPTMQAVGSALQQRLGDVKANWMHLERFLRLQREAEEAERGAEEKERKATRETEAADDAASQKARNEHKKKADDNNRSAAEDRKRAGDARAVAASEARKGGNPATAAAEEEAAAENYRKQSQDLRKGGKTGTEVNRPMEAAAKAEERAAADHRAAAGEHDKKAKEADKKGDAAAAAQERAAAKDELYKTADALGRAAGDLSAAGKGRESRDMRAKARAARDAAEAYGR